MLYPYLGTSMARTFACVAGGTGSSTVPSSCRGQQNWSEDTRW